MLYVLHLSKLQIQQYIVLIITLTSVVIPLTYYIFALSYFLVLLLTNILIIYYISICCKSNNTYYVYIILYNWFLNQLREENFKICSFSIFYNCIITPLVLFICLREFELPSEVT